MTLEERVLELEKKLKSVVSEEFEKSYTGVRHTQLITLENLAQKVIWHHNNINDCRRDVWDLQSRMSDVERKLELNSYKPSYEKKKWYKYLKFWTWFKRKQVTTYIPYKEFSEKLCDCPDKNWMDQYYQGIFK